MNHTPALLLVCSLLAPIVSAQEVEIVEEFVVGSSGATPISGLKLPADVARAWIKKDTSTLFARAKSLIESAPQDHRGYALEYLTHLVFRKDRTASRKTATTATGALSKSPKAMVAFVDQALFHDPEPNEYRMAMMALMPMVPDRRTDADLRIAYLRALEGAGKVREAVLMNKTIVEDLGDDGNAQRRLAAAICDMKNGRSLAVFAKKAIEKAATKLGDDQELQKTRYRVLHDLLGLPDEARKLGEAMVKKEQLGTNLNNFVWYLMVETPDAGKFPSLALLGARRMLTAQSIAENEWDTIALAFFRNGLIDEAIQYQQKALDMGRGQDPDYLGRMKMYLAAKKVRDAAKRAKSAGDGKQEAAANGAKASGGERK